MLAKHDFGCGSPTMFQTLIKRLHSTRSPAQFTGAPAPGLGVAPPLSARVGSASASGQGRSLGRATLVIETGSIRGGRSANPPVNWLSYDTVEPAYGALVPEA
jgi:hypothetical protein